MLQNIKLAHMLEKTNTPFTFAAVSLYNYNTITYYLLSAICFRLEKVCPNSNQIIHNEWAFPVHKMDS